MAKLKLLVATTNPGKVKEIKNLLQEEYVNVVSLSDLPETNGIDVDETGSTFMENATLKARTYGRLSGILTLADDSGLSVTALGGKPGVESKRYEATDAKRIERLLKEMTPVEDKDRQASFICAMALYDPASDKFYQSEGRVDGYIIQKPTGTHGFGYDPVFYSTELGKTFGEAEEAEKNQISHRARALSGIKKIIHKRSR